MKLISTIVSAGLIILGFLIIVIYAELPWSTEIRPINKVNSKFSIDIKSDFYGRGDRNLYPFGSLAEGTQTLLLANLVNQKIKTNIILKIESVDCENDAVITISNDDGDSVVRDILVAGEKNTITYSVLLGPHKAQINYFHLQLKNIDQLCQSKNYPYAITDWKYHD